jgi:hypothetical protein
MYSEYNHIVHETEYGGKENDELFYINNHIPIPSNFTHYIEYFQTNNNGS